MFIVVDGPWGMIPVLARQGMAAGRCNGYLQCAVVHGARVIILAGSEMMSEFEFEALVVRETEDGRMVREIETRQLEDLPDGDVLVRVLYSSLNYKDVLSAIGNRGVTKRYPHTPGIDAAGIVEQSRVEAFKPGDQVIVTSYDLGMNTPGGFGQYIRVPADWVVRCPAGMSLRTSMIYGTAGFTAALSVHRLENAGLEPAKGPVLVSGATGGVGSIAVSILAKAGYKVTAVNGVVDGRDYLLELGAGSVISIEEATDTSGKPLLPARWAAAVDTLGGPILATTIRSVKPWGVVTCCGNVASPELPLTVYPFILRGVSVLGIDSQSCPMEVRKKVWKRIAGEWMIDNLDRLVTEVTLDQVDEAIERVLNRQNRGRTLIRLDPRER